MAPSAQNDPHRVARDASRLVRFVRNEGRKLNGLLIYTHDYPDPDSLASAFGLKHLVRLVAGVDAEIVYGGVIGRTENREMVSRLRIPLRRVRRGDGRRGGPTALVD